MKKVFIFLFIICTQLPFALTKLVLQWQKKAVRREVKKRINDGLKDEELVKLTFHQDDVNKLLKWAKKDEFDFNDQMYDIVRSWESNDSITYMCWKDDDESIIKQRLNQLSELEWSKNTSNKRQNERKTDFYKTLICTKPDTPMHKWVFANQSNQAKIPFVTNDFSSYITLPHAPPPEYQMYVLITKEEVLRS